MEITCTIPDKRTWIFFFLILFVALLWSSFLLVTGQMLATSVMLAVLAGFISLFSFTCCAKYRSWIFFYLIVLVALLWASFLLMQGVMVWVSVLLVLISVGSSLFSFMFCEKEQ